MLLALAQFSDLDGLGQNIFPLLIYLVLTVLVGHLLYLYCVYQVAAG